MLKSIPNVRTVRFRNLLNVAEIQEEFVLNIKKRGGEKRKNVTEEFVSKWITDFPALPANKARTRSSLPRLYCGHLGILEYRLPELQRKR